MSASAPPVATGMVPPGLLFADELFNSTFEIEYYRDSHFQQSYRHLDHRIYCETLLTLRCASAPALQLLRGPWDWWDHGRVTGFRCLHDGSSVQVISPIAWFWTRVGIRVYPPLTLVGLPGVRLPILLTRHFVGTSSIDVWERDGRTFLRGRFHGVENRVPLVPAGLAGRQHLRAEAGTCASPFPTGTGWCGLCRRLEKDCAGSQCCGEFFPGSSDSRPGFQR